MADCSLLCTRLVRQLHAWKVGIKPDVSGQHEGTSDKLIIPDSAFNEQQIMTRNDIHSCSYCIKEEVPSTPLRLCFLMTECHLVVKHGTAGTFIGLYLVHLQDNSCKIRRPLLLVPTPNK